MPWSPAPKVAELSSLPLVLSLLAGCAGPDADSEPPALRYVGSSTVGHFVRDADAAYDAARFVIDTEPESAGGEAAILAGRADLAGCAGRPSEETLALGVVATLVGQDAIAAIVHPSNPVRGLGSEDLRALFTGRVRRWSELGGPDLPVHAYVVGPESATRRVFRSAVLGPEDYADCTVIRPDTRMITAVASDPGGIGQISAAFLGAEHAVVALEVDGEAPRSENARYPVTRPLYLLWWPGRRRVADFVAWTSGPEATAVLLRRFALPPPPEGAEGPR